jgi:hypothetical protein
MRCSSSASAKAVPASASSTSAVLSSVRGNRAERADLESLAAISTSRCARRSRPPRRRLQQRALHSRVPWRRWLRDRRLSSSRSSGRLAAEQTPYGSPISSSRPEGSIKALITPVEPRAPQRLHPDAELGSRARTPKSIGFPRYCTAVSASCGSRTVAMSFQVPAGLNSRSR